MKKAAETGTELTLEMVAGEIHSASSAGSGSLDVFSTPSLVAFMEKTSLKLVEPLLEDNESTVGVHIDIRHLKASPTGSRIKCRSVLTAAEGRKFTFEVKAWDEKGLIGEGVHSRMLIDVPRFMEKINRER